MQISEYVDNLEKGVRYFNDLPVIVEKIQRVLSTITAYHQHRLPQQPLKELELDENIIFENLVEYPGILDFISYLENFRQVLVENMGIWHVINQKWIDDLQDFVGPEACNLEIMAGNALISANLKNTIATDNLKWEGQDNQKPQPWTSVEKIDALNAVSKYYPHVDNIIMAWAPDNVDVDHQVLKFLRQCKFKGNLIVIGEKLGATNSQQFWNSAHLSLPKQLNRNHQAFDFINDQVWLENDFDE